MVDIYFRRMLVVDKGYQIESSLDGERWNCWSHPEKYKNKTDVADLFSRLQKGYADRGMVMEVREDD